MSSTIHTYIIHTYVHTYIHTYIYVHAYIHYKYVPPVSVVHTVSVRELWALIVDMRLQGNMSREQFIKSAKYLTIGTTDTYIHTCSTYILKCLNIMKCILITH